LPSEGRPDLRDCRKSEDGVDLLALWLSMQDPLGGCFRFVRGGAPIDGIFDFRHCLSRSEMDLHPRSIPNLANLARS